jgi:hypothetical protein
MFGLNSFGWLHYDQILIALGGLRLGRKVQINSGSAP